MGGGGGVGGGGGGGGGGGWGGGGGGGLSHPNREDHDRQRITAGVEGNCWSDSMPATSTGFVGSWTSTFESPGASSRLGSAPYDRRDCVSGGGPQGGASSSG